MERLKVEKEKKIAELRSRQAKSSDAVKLYGLEVKNRQEALAKAEEKLGMVARLKEQKIAEHKDLLLEKIELVNRNLELERAHIGKASVARELELLAGGTD
jgi:hypothetical protein